MADPEFFTWLVDSDAITRALNDYRGSHPEDPCFQNTMSVAKRVRGTIVSRWLDYQRHRLEPEDHWFRADHDARCGHCRLPVEAAVHKRCPICGSRYHNPRWCPDGEVWQRRQEWLDDQT